MFKYSIYMALLAAGSIAVGCSDDDGANVPRKGPIVVAGSGGSAGDGGSGSDDTDAGVGGSSGSAGSGGGDGGSAGSAPACVPPVFPDAGLDAGADASLDASADGGPILRIVSFAADIQPIFAARCGPCHVTNSSAGHNVGGADIDEAYADAIELGAVLVERVNGGGMPPDYAEAPNNCGYQPPGSPGCITVAELELLQTWLAQCSQP